MDDDVEVRRATRVEEVLAAGHLFDTLPTPGTAARFLEGAGHQLLVAHVGARPVGFVTGVETTNPDKEPEMLVYELGVDEGFRRRGVAAALLDALTAVARERGHRGLWVLTEPDNVAALATYRRLAGEGAESVVLDWEA